MATVNEMLERAKRNGLSKLVLQTVHTCNLRCPYCISDAGRWGKDDVGLMSQDVALNTLEKFATIYGNINIIYFFGGEPALNLKIIEAVAKKSNELVTSAKLGHLPTFAFTTNGTIASSEFIKLVNAHRIIFNVSIDGPPEIHDKLRPSADGSSTYHHIVENIHKLREMTGQPSALEMTYTLEHLHHKYSLWEMLKYLHNETGVGIVSVTPAINSSYTTFSKSTDPSSEKEEVIRQFTETALESTMSLAEDDNPTVMLQVIKIFKHLVDTKGMELCPAGRSYFAVARNGDIYPCQNIPETKNYLISNIYSETLWEDIHKADVVRQLIDANANAVGELANKWYKRFCRICPAENMSETGNLVEYSPFRHELHATIAGTVIGLLPSITADESKYRKLMENLRKIDNVADNDD